MDKNASQDLRSPRRKISKTTITEEQLLPFELHSLHEQLLAKARKELFENEEATLGKLVILRNLLSDSGIEFLDEDHFLLIFLRARKFNEGKAAILVKNFFRHFRKRHDIYGDLNVSIVQKHLRTNLMGILPYRDKDGSAIIAFKCALWDPEKLPMKNLVHLFITMFLQALAIPATQIAGLKLIIDLCGMTVKKFSYITPKYWSMYLDAMQNSFPARFRGLHFINSKEIFVTIWKPFAKLLPKKLRERVYFHGKDLTELHNHISPRILPAEWGGELEPYDNTEWADSLTNYENFITKICSIAFDKQS